MSISTNLILRPIFCKLCMLLIKVIGLVIISSPFFKLSACKTEFKPLVQEFTAKAFLLFINLEIFFSNFDVVFPLVNHPDLRTLETALISL